MASATRPLWFALLLGAVACSGRAEPGTTDQPDGTGTGGNVTQGTGGELGGDPSQGFSGWVFINLGEGGGVGGVRLDCDLDKGCTPEESTDPGTTVTTTLSATDEQNLTALTEQLSAVSELDASGFASRYATEWGPSPDFDATTAIGMDVVQDSALALDADELAQLQARGFVISERQTFPSYVYGYKTFYVEDLPLYVSADSILFAVHQSFDSLLRSLEDATLIPALNRILDSMRSGFDRARAAGHSDQALADADLYLSVAKSLMAGSAQSPVAGASAEEIACLLQAVGDQDGCVRHDFFGTSRVFDFSQFKVRGHYTSSVELGRYFQAMMWLGRVDLRLLETQTNATQRFNRRQLEAALALRELMDDQSRADWQTIDRVVGAFVGEHDSMTLPQLDSLLGDLQVTSLAELAAVSDQTIAQAIIAGRYGTQRISSHIMAGGFGNQPMPLSSTFLLFGQRYVVDSHVFSNVVFDRVDCSPEGGSPPCRMMPKPLDVGFAACGNDQAAALLAPELEQYEYAGDLAEMRVLVDAHPADYWDGNLYNLWLSSLRALSAAAEARDTVGAGLPTVAGTEAWGRRLLNTQLASWSELRHDTLLYAKQSYTAVATICDYPDAYVEPYPAFWARLVAFAEHGRTLVNDLALAGAAPPDSVGAYFDRLAEIATILGQMAERQRSGASHDPEHIAFINQAVTLHYAGGGCGGGADAESASGWYAELFFSPTDAVAFDPNIADVHTQPANEVGAEVGRILHVGTGMPRVMVVTAENCSGPRAYVGLVSSYFERITDNWQRMTDEEWSQELLQETPADVPWMTDLVVR